LPRNSQAEAPSLLIAAISARSLVQSARRAGFAPLAADFFADTDTQAAAQAWDKLPGGMARGMRAQPLLRALDALAKRAPSPIAGFVYGAGFEDRPELLELIAARWPLLGNDADTVRRIKAPGTFFATLDQLGIRHPDTTSKRPRNGAGWLAKKIGGAGGSHIGPSRLAAGPDVYFQRSVGARAVSALFLGNGEDARVLGFSEQWTSPSSRSRFRYGGAVRPASLPQDVARQMTSAVIGVARAFKLRGLASADFLVNDRDALLLEINPRPGATLDIFDCGATPLLRLHVDAVDGARLPPRPLKLGGAMASAIVYAVTDGAARRGFVWPEWSADRPKSSERIDKNRPICTVSARATTTSRAKRLIEERTCKILAVFQSVSRGEDGEQKRRNRRRAPAGAPKRQRQGGAAGQGSHR
jgi:predicted ATP-grasp superfamily ATP-dependent carboligase